MSPPRLAALAALVGLSGCVPYAVGAPPDTVAPQEVRPSVVLQVASARRDLQADDEPGGAALAVGNEARLGLDERSDVGVRLVGLGSLTATYKRKVAGPLGSEEGVAVLVGAGVIGSRHLHAEATVVASPGPLAVAPQVVPYGGVRLQDLTPFAGDALATAPALGLFFGARIGWPDLAVAPELGLFYSPSPLAGDGEVVVVPSVTLHGDRIRKALGL
ncbi:hypothetical protein [Rubrivirga sp. IMCC43871]|uniref:hypothetical protein n=1 Tax=Rubrivirga sp. IMCC43871 TaxID=3391575 RepID=UPI00398FFD9C